jgi:hypothetical protein
LDTIFEKSLKIVEIFKKEKKYARKFSSARALENRRLPVNRNVSGPRNSETSSYIRDGPKSSFPTTSFFLSP